MIKNLQVHMLELSQRTIFETTKEYVHCVDWYDMHRLLRAQWKQQEPQFRFRKHVDGVSGFVQNERLYTLAPLQ